MSRSPLFILLIGLSNVKAQTPFCEGHPGNPVATNLGNGMASCSFQANGRGGFTTNIALAGDTIITWESLLNRSNDVLNFSQQNGNGSVLNIIDGSGNVLLDGSITADGNLGFLAPNLGIRSAFEVGGMISANDLTLATHSLDTANQANWFAGGTLVFENSAPLDQSLNTNGQLEARSGDILLVAEDIFNNATLTAPNGTIALAAGQNVTIDRNAAPLITTISTSTPSGTGHTISNTSPQIQGETISFKAADQIANQPNSALTTNSQTTGRIFLQVNGETNQIQVEQDDLTGQVSFDGVIVNPITFDPSDPSNPSGRSATISRFPRLDESAQGANKTQTVVSNVPSVSSPKLKQANPAPTKPEKEPKPEETQRKSYYRGQSFFGLRGSRAATKKD